MEILEAYEPNSGRDPCPVFLKRCRSQECTDCAAQSRLELSSHHRGGCHTVTVTARHRRGPRSQASRLVRHWRVYDRPTHQEGLLLRSHQCGSSQESTVASGTQLPSQEGLSHCDSHSPSQEGAPFTSLAARTTLAV